MTEKVIYQHGTLGALMAGLMEGNETIINVLTHGDLGLGTLHGLDGEVIILDGMAYQGRSDGSLIQLTGEETTPYAAVTNFQPEISTEQTNSDSKKIKETILTLAETKNLFLAVKIKGRFDRMHIRIMPKQQPPYKRLIEVSADQPEFTKESINGTIVGFFTPELFQGVAAAGFHLHFVDDDHLFGGHVLDFELKEGTIDISRLESLYQHLPINDKQFTHQEIDYADLEAEIEAAEN